jgi:hypothetical protein
MDIVDDMALALNRERADLDNEAAVIRSLIRQGYTSATINLRLDEALREARLLRAAQPSGMLQL